MRRASRIEYHQRSQAQILLPVPQQFYHPRVSFDWQEFIHKARNEAESRLSTLCTPTPRRRDDAAEPFQLVPLPRSALHPSSEWTS